MGDVREIGSRLELFVDDWLIEEMDGAGLRLHQPIPREVALTFDRPWESPVSSCSTVMLDEGRFRLWYRAGADAVQRVAYAESEDGINWERVATGLVEFDGSRDNNILLDGSFAKQMAVFKDDNPAATDEQRYKAISRIRHIDGERDAIRGYHSPDGIAWETFEKDPLLVAPDDGTRPIFDSHNVAFWDGLTGQYVMYMRSWIPDPDSFRGGGFRSIRRSTSEDFVHWQPPRQIDLGDSWGEHLYTNACIQYFRAPHIYMMFPRRFVPERQFHDEPIPNGASEGVFMTSRDGIRWDRRFMEPFLPPGPDPDNWTDRNMTVGVGVVPTGSAEISLYYKDHNLRPTARFRRGALRTDGFVSAYAPFGGGEVLTKPLTFAGRELVLNYATSAAGRLRVEVQDIEGRPLEGRSLSDSAEIFGDEIERVVRWSGGSNVSDLSGKPVRLRFAMEEAHVYSLRFRPS